MTTEYVTYPTRQRARLRRTLIQVQSWTGIAIGCVVLAGFYWLANRMEASKGPHERR
jgi:hypothetical protein